jgi:predicted ferric reductase
MTDVDSYTGWVDDSTGEAFLFDEFSPNYEQPFQDSTRPGGKTSYTGLSGSQVDGWTTISFTRPLSASDAYDYDLHDSASKSFFVVWAYHADLDVFGTDYFKHTSCGASSVPSFQQSSTAGPAVNNSQLTCGDVILIMVFIFVVVVAAVRFVAKLRQRQPNWTVLHFLGGRGPFDTPAGAVVLFTGYVVLNILCLFLVPSQFPHARNLGYLAAANLCLVTVIASRNSIVLAMVGLSFEQVMQFHRWMGRWTVLLMAVHTGLYVKLWETDSDATTSVSNLWTNTVYLNGLVSLGAGAVMLVSSIEYMRRNFFNLFMFFHITGFIIALVTAYFHKPWFGAYLAVAGCFWLLDQVLRVVVYSSLWPTKCLEATVFNKDVVRLRLSIPACRLKVPGGSFVFINIPALSLFEWHPFSVTSTSRDGFVEVYIRPSGDWTCALKLLVERQESRFTARWQGPYGQTSQMNEGLRHYNLRLLLGGGIGVTPLIGYIKELCRLRTESPNEAGQWPEDMELQHTPSRTSSRTSISLNGQPRYYDVSASPLPNTTEDTDMDEFEFDSALAAPQFPLPEQRPWVVSVVLKPNVYANDSASTVTSNQITSSSVAKPVGTVYLVWVVRVAAEFDMFEKVLLRAKTLLARDKIELRARVFVSKTATASPLDARFEFGRPNLPRIFEEIGLAHPDQRILCVAV